MTTTLSGLATVRAFRAQHFLREQFFSLQDEHTSTYFLSIAASRFLGNLVTSDHSSDLFLGVTLDWICWLFVLSVSVTIMLLFQGDLTGLSRL